jgi:hypothetical protein
VAQQRVASITANLYSQGNQKQSKEVNDQWSNYLQDNFTEKKYEKAQIEFSSKNARLNKAIENKESKRTRKMEMETIP